MSKARNFPGLGFVPEYQRSGTPFCTASNGTEINSSTTTQISFPKVTRWVEITPYAQDSSAYLKIGFTQNGVEQRGAVTGSFQIGLDESGNVEFLKTIPNPNTYEQSATARNWFAVPCTADSLKQPGGVRLELACTDLFLQTDAGTAGVTVVAGLTNVLTTDYLLTGSRGFTGVG